MRNARITKTKALVTLATSVAAVASLSLPLPSVAQADTYTVTATDDPVPDGCGAESCTLREAVIGANAHPGRDVIVLEGGEVYRRSPTPGTDEPFAKDGMLDVTDPLTIRSTGKGLATIDGNENEGVLETRAPTRLVRLRIQNGNTVNNSFRSGAGIIAGDAGLTVVESRIIDNVTAGDGGGIAGGRVRIVRSVIRNNYSYSSGGGVMVYDGSKVSIVDSTIQGNRTLDCGGGIENRGLLKVSGSTISANRARCGGGLNNFPAWHLKVRASLTNDTFTLNEARDAGGGITSGGNRVSVEMNAVTVARNVARRGAGGLWHFPPPDGPSGAFIVENSMITLNRSGRARSATASNCAGRFASRGHNLVSGGCAGFGSRGDLVDSRPMIGRLAPAGGPTSTIALNAGSPAINGASPATAPKVDQRGRGRGRKPDIGAYERRCR